MKRTLFLGAVALLLFTQCEREKDPFLITKGAVGHLTKTTMMKQVDSIFAQDSLVRLSPINNALGTQGEVEIYENGGKKLLLISPEDENDPESLISNIQVFDDRYHTEKGLTVGSTFKDLKDNYEIDGVQTALRSVLVFIKDSDVYVNIEKTKLPENLRYDPSLEIESTQIPDDAPFQFFMVGWDHN